MVVYLVRSGAMMDWHVYGVFSTEALAESFRATLVFDEEARVSEWDVDARLSPANPFGASR